MIILHRCDLLTFFLKTIQLEGKANRFVGIKNSHTSKKLQFQTARRQFNSRSSYCRNIQYDELRSKLLMEDITLEHIYATNQRQRHAGIVDTPVSDYRLDRRKHLKYFRMSCVRRCWMNFKILGVSMYDILIHYQNRFEKNLF